MPEDNAVATAPETVEQSMPEATVEGQQQQQHQQQQSSSNNTNINDLSLDNQVDNEDPEADADAVILPHEGIHLIRLKAGKKGVYGPTTDKDGNPLQSPKLDKNNRAFFVAEVEAYLVSDNPKYDGIRIFCFQDALQNGIYLTSLVQARTQTSAAADVANKTGYPFQKGSPLGQRRDHMQQLLAAEPSIKGLIQWQATRETGEQDENGYPVRVIAVRGEKNFEILHDKEGGIQQDTDGTALRNPRMTLPDGQEVVARAVITRFLPVNS